MHPDSSVATNLQCTCTVGWTPPACGATPPEDFAGEFGFPLDLIKVSHGEPLFTPQEANEVDENEEILVEHFYTVATNGSCEAVLWSHKLKDGFIWRSQNGCTSLTKEQWDANPLNQWLRNFTSLSISLFQRTRAKPNMSCIDNQSQNFKRAVCRCCLRFRILKEDLSRDTSWSNIFFNRDFDARYIYKHYLEI